jgi:hypothetical protein
VATEFYRCRRAFAAPFGSGLVEVVKEGTLVSDSDPRYRANPAAFQPISEIVEQTTAAPGEKRSLSAALRNRGRNRTMPHRNPLPPEHEDSPANPVAPLQPAAGYVAPDVPDEQNPAGGPKSSDKPGTATKRLTGELAGDVAAPNEPAAKVEGTKATPADNTADNSGDGKGGAKGSGSSKDGGSSKS